MSADTPFDTPQVTVVPTERGFADRTVSFLGRLITLAVVLGVIGAVWMYYKHRSGGSRDSGAGAAQSAEALPAQDSTGKTGVGFGDMLASMAEAIRPPSTGGVSAGLEIEQAKQAAAANAAVEQDGAPGVPPALPVAYPGTAGGVFGSGVLDANGKKAGTIHDILVDRETGVSTAIIMDNDKSYRGVDLTAVRFGDVEGGTPSGDVRISAAADDASRVQPFRYDRLPEGRYISLLALQGGRVLDDRGRIAGRIDAVTYRNGSARNIVFTVPSPVEKNKGTSFVIPYRDVTVAAPDAVQLDRRQTAALAYAVLPPENAAGR